MGNEEKETKWRPAARARCEFLSLVGGNVIQIKSQYYTNKRIKSSWKKYPPNSQQEKTSYKKKKEETNNSDVCILIEKREGTGGNCESIGLCKRFEKRRAFDSD